MSKHRIVKHVKCPYYKHEDTQMIYCDGVDDSSTIHLAFAKRNESIDYKKGYCRDCYTKCLIYRMLEAKENE